MVAGGALFELASKLHSPGLPALVQSRTYATAVHTTRHELQSYKLNPSLHMESCTGSEKDSVAVR